MGKKADWVMESGGIVCWETGHGCSNIVTSPKESDRADAFRRSCGGVIKQLASSVGATTGEVATRLLGDLKSSTKPNPVVEEFVVAWSEVHQAKARKAEHK